MFRPHPAMQTLSHRTSPLPRTPWVMHMTWHDLLFAHWRVPPEVLRPHVPPGLKIDTFDGSAWLGVIPFRMTGIRLRGAPPMPTTHRFAEINLRTYVSHGGVRGVWFFTLDATSCLGSAIARRWFNLNYLDAAITCENRGDAVAYHSVRRGHGGAAEFRAVYRPVSDPFHAIPGAIEHFLTERYCLYAADHQGRLYRGDIHHAPWPLQHAEAHIETNTMASPLDLDLPETDHLLFARRMDVVVWWPKRLRGIAREALT